MRSIRGRRASSNEPLGRMMDKFSKETRTRIMSSIHSRDTLPEIIVRKWLWAHGWRFRVQYKKVPGHPDVAIPKIRTLIEIRGCFWHQHKGCPDATVPETNRAFWTKKFRANRARDARHEKEWAELGWNLIVIWACGLKTAEARERTFARLEKWLAECSTGACDE